MLNNFIALDKCYLLVYVFMRHLLLDAHRRDAEKVARCDVWKGMVGWGDQRGWEEEASLGPAQNFCRGSASAGWASLPSLTETQVSLGRLRV